MTSKKTAIKPCPFCGKQPKMSTIGETSTQRYMLKCEPGIDTHGFFIRYTETAVITEWNRRLK